MASIEPEFIYTGGNRHPSAADWDFQRSGLLAFGANDNIALWDPLGFDSRGVKTVLSGHTDVVNVVKFFPTGSTQSTIILSGSVDKTIRVWKAPAETATGYEQVQVISEHQSSVNCIATLRGSDIFVSGSADATLKVWKVENNADFSQVHVKLLQSISLTPRYFPLAISLAHLDSANLLLAAAGTKASIQIYVTQKDNFKLVATLTGHEGWIRALTFTRETEDEASDLLLASASQDKYIRLWRVHQGEELPAVSNAAKDPALGTIGQSLSNKPHRFRTDKSEYSITFEALLLGHEDWIFTAAWKLQGDKLRLLSSSADNSLAIWEPDPVSGIWVCIARLGEISVQKGATTATGSTGGFWIGLWSPGGEAVVSLGRTGSWRLWAYDLPTDRWEQKVAISGHFREVKGVSWAKDGSYLLSTGSDQTTRLFAEWKRSGQRSWHEFSRPQIHGYDLNCIGIIKNTQLITGADEKLLRVFDEPGTIAGLLQRLCQVSGTPSQDLPDAANIPVLGLSNKAIQAVEDSEVPSNADEDQRDVVDPASIIYKSTLDINHPPLEDHLARHLLWPEREKLYGHGYEISALATSHNGKLVATACRASSIDHAVIRLYDTEEWREVKPPLAAHSLTVTRLEFSSDDKYLLSVGRDRQWAVFQRSTEASTEYHHVASDLKGHSRMILDASWAPSKDLRLFATAGRDKTVKIWQLDGNGGVCKAKMAASAPVTAVAFLPRPLGKLLVVAHGLGNGHITISVIDTEKFEVVQSMAFDPTVCPSKAINQMAWRPNGGSYYEECTPGEASHTSRAHHLAVASDDTTVRLYQVFMPVFFDDSSYFDGAQGDPSEDNQAGDDLNGEEKQGGQNSQDGRAEKEMDGPILRDIRQGGASCVMDP